jgi:hypothetical protein
MHEYEVRPRKDKRGFDLISDALPFGRLWHGEPNALANAIGYAMHRSRSHDAVIRFYDSGRQCDRDARSVVRMLSCCRGNVTLHFERIKQIV